MRTAIAICCAAGLTATYPAAAQSCGPQPPPGSGPPILHLTANTTVKVQPTILVADLTALARSATAVPAQRRVNQLMAEAKALASASRGIDVVFEDYSTNYVEEKGRNPAYWTASQTVELRGQSGEAVLDLVGRLQAIGLTINGLDWQVPDEQANAAGREAAIKALTTLRQQAAAAAKALDLHVQGYRSVDLSSGPFPIAPMPRFGAAQMVAAMPPPQAIAQTRDITVTVSANVIPGPAVTPAGTAHP